MTDSTQTPALSGRELARARRRDMSRTGSAKIKPAGRINPRKAAKSVVSAVTPTPAPASVVSKPQEELVTTPVVEPVSTGVVQKSLSGKALSMARRAMLAKNGKGSLPSAPKEVGRTRKPSVVKSQVEQAVVADPVKSEACCEACANNEPCEGEKLEQSADEAVLDSLCEIIDSNPSAAAGASSTVRDLCRQRRSSLAKKGKLALPGKAGRQALKSLVRGATGSTMTGRALAKLHRDNQCAIGRGDGAACRPSGRVRTPVSVPSKVEEGTTLSGQTVSGTQVEQTDKITGSEAGACRAVTGTEYLGLEQYENFCSSAPQPAAAKVGFSETGRGQVLTGSNTALSQKVTGDEAGACKMVTGSEYLGVEHFGSVCSSASVMNRSAEKVVVGSTSKSQRITGVDEARDNAVTGSESGASAIVTGSDYADVGLKKNIADAPAKVSMSHTVAGVSVSGGESLRNTGVTGDDQDLCRRVTGTEYISSERFQGACGTAPQASVAKVGVDSSRGGMGITGNLVNRSEKVTGNEPGTCQRVTGSQYDSSQSTMCDNRTTKVHAMHTLQGGVLTGTEASPSPKLTGDDRGSCTVVTGSEYVSKEYFQQSCSQVPPAKAAMTGLSRTWHNQVISGVQTGHSAKTTGDESGLCNTVTGSNYAAREEMTEFCSANVVAQSEQRLSQHEEAAMPVSGVTPAVDQRMAGGFQRGACQSVSGTPYQGQEDRMLCNSGVRHHLVQPEQSVQASAEVARSYQSGFSVVSPAKAAWDRRANDPVHSSVYAHRSSITGSVNKAEGVISGTPEFRHSRNVSPVSPAVAAEPEAQVDRITGEGRENGAQITGDDWSRGGLVTGTEGLFSAGRNQTQQGTASVVRNNIGARALKDRERPEVVLSKVTGGSGNAPTSMAGLVTLSGGASA